MPTIQAPDRQQLTFMNTLDDLVALDHPVRALDALVDHIIGADPAFFNHLAPQTSAGRRGYPAGALIKLLLYGYLHGISSSRKLAAEAGRNIEVIWLLSTLAPSYNLIADYRKDYPDEQALEGRLAKAHQQLEDWLERLALNDALEDAEQDLAASGTEAPGTEPELMEQIERLHRRIRGLPAADK